MRYQNGLELRIWRDDSKHEMRFEHGEATAPLEITGAAEGQSGTEITFKPSTETFSNVEFDFTTLENRLRELAFLNSGVRIRLTDDRKAEQKVTEFYYDGGLIAFVDYLNKARNALHPTIYADQEKEEVGVELALSWTDSFHESTLCFTNNIPQRDGGTHLAGFRGALTRIINNYAQDSGIAKKEKVALTGDDSREGLTAIVSVKVPDPKFSSQTKDKLVSSEVRPIVEQAVSDALGQWFEEHPAEARKIVSKAYEAACGERSGTKGT
jgi:DNA gyrase subunit B